MIEGTYKIHIFEPPVRGDGAIIAIHGGGWVLADVPMSYKLFSKMALETNSIVFAPDYRTAPEFKFPQGLGSRGLSGSGFRSVHRSLIKLMSIV